MAVLSARPAVCHTVQGAPLRPGFPQCGGESRHERMVAGMDLNVTADEAGILRDFFRVQSDKHGPELLSRLNNIQYGEEEERRREGPVKMEQVVEEVIQQEIQAEAAMRNSSPGSECSSEGPGPVLPEHMALAFGPPGARAMGPWLLGPGGLVLPLPLHEQTALGELLRLQQGGGVSPPPSDRHLGVSVIQKAPAARSPRLYLERRETLSPSPHPAPLQLLKRKVERREEGLGPVPKRRSNQQQSDHLICEVCGERAGKHSYYGGQVSIKNFKFQDHLAMSCCDCLSHQIEMLLFPAP